MKTNGILRVVARFNAANLYALQLQVLAPGRVRGAARPEARALPACATPRLKGLGFWQRLLGPSVLLRTGAFAGTLFAAVDGRLRGLTVRYAYASA